MSSIQRTVHLTRKRSYENFAATEASSSAEVQTEQPPHSKKMKEEVDLFKPINVIIIMLFFRMIMKSLKLEFFNNVLLIVELNCRFLIFYADNSFIFLIIKTG